MSEWGYVAMGYGVTFGALGLYLLRVLRRGRALSRSLPRQERTWR
jgi:heme exporter protein CcmD